MIAHQMHVEGGDTHELSEVHFKAYWVAAMISMSVAALFTVPLLVVAFALASAWSVALTLLVALTSGRTKFLGLRSKGST